jgi:uncharacterized protein (TIGR00255 family)
MMQSMTGFGRAQVEMADKKLIIEIRSLNSKQADINTRIWSLYREKELDLRSHLASRLERGKIDISIYAELQGEAGAQSINHDLVKKYYRELHALESELDTKSDLMNIILKLPEVMKTEKEELTKEEWTQVMVGVDEAVDKLLAFRRDEGTAMKNDLDERVRTIRTLKEEVDAMKGERIDYLKQRMLDSLEASQVDVDENRFEQELIYYLEKLDINEELVRLTKHLDYFEETSAVPSSGKKLGFICQEIGREINTLGSKANHADIQKKVILMKDQLEKMKEQVLNVL